MISNNYRRNYDAERALLDALGEEEADARILALQGQTTLPEAIA